MYRDFSLLKLFLLVEFFVLLFAILLFSINPARRHAEEYNTKRLFDIILIASAVSLYFKDNPNNIPANLSIEGQEISKKGFDICSILIPKYIVYLPKDPSLESPDVTKPCPSDYQTNYYIKLNTNNTFTISAPDTAIPPADKVISVTRRF